jgi:RimJ/RimL family protein N-acetyltransferase
MWQEMLARLMPWQGQRIRLRFITPDDAWLHVRLSNEADVRRFLGPSLNQTEAEAREALKRVSPKKDSLYVIELTSDGTSVGYCGFILNRYIAEMDMLISLLPEYQRSGYGSEVLSILQSAWLGQLGNDECFATVWPENKGAVALLRSHGFVKVREYVDEFDQVHHVYKCSRDSFTT